MATPKTIQIFLPDGNPRGVKLAEITSRTVLAAQVPRASLSFMSTREELSAVGVYLLIGDDEIEAPRVYVGEAEDCYKRLGQHISAKEFWSRAIVFVSQKQQFTKSHVKYLEWYCLKVITKIGRAICENTVIPKKPYIPEPVEADLLDIFDTMRILASTLDCPVFEELRKTPNKTGEKHFHIKTRSADAVGEYTSDGFTLYQGSKCNPAASKSLAVSNQNRRNALLDSGVLKQDGDFWVVTKDHLFKSPSAAGAVVLGRENNGWTTWKYKDGRTLDEVIRQEGEPSE